MQNMVAESMEGFVKPTMNITRLSLNYKGLPYRTEWIEYPDLKPTLEALGVPPNDKDTNPNASYSSPVVRMPDGAYIMDSLKIATALEKLQPEPSLHLNNGYIDRVQTIVLDIMKGLGPNIYPLIPKHVLPQSSAEYFSETRAKRFGMPLPELAKSDKAGETAWSSARPAIERLGEVLGERKEGPYLMGTTVSFADFVVAGFFRFVEVLDQELFGRLVGMDKGFGMHYEACKEWLERDSR
ncbi:hypothetical protein LTR62_008072 [Meristemomyces frigidus]|uniref:GST N-terminal domain-containing protein n=1 Tax=Meristemomyces frigidus TaxID=1508187 RepID=A0AAN7TBI0_9PEZI|nr:hypothetical protein LTR62_008072 [Meristemomyces frigidus]